MQAPMQEFIELGRRPPFAQAVMHSGPTPQRRAYQSQDDPWD
jgi:hypothetical protein